MTTTDRVPLPEVLSTCPCPNRPNFHLTTCEVAIAHEAIPLSERPEYTGQGQRFAAISWEYPMHIEGSIRIDISVDPELIILEHLDEYHRFQPEDGYQPWEKPAAFIVHLITEQLEPGGVYFGVRRASRDMTDIDEIRVRDRGYQGFGQAEAEALMERIANRPNPNQATLDV